MRDHFNRVRPRRQSECRLAEVAQELRLLSLSEGLSFCVSLQGRRDPRFEHEVERWLGRARQECGLNDANAALLEAAAAAPEGQFEQRALEVIERANRRLHAMDSPPVRRSDRSRLRAMRDWKPPTRPRPTLPESATARLAVIAAAVFLASSISVMAARGDPQLVGARGDPDTGVRRKLAPSPQQNRCPIPARLRGAFVVAARKTDLPLPLLVAVARAESNFDTAAHSGAGAIGVLQLMPATARAMGVDPTDPDANVIAGARYLRSLFSRFGSSRLALAAYNAGPTSVAAGAGALHAETQTYVANVRRTWRSLRGCR